MSELQGDIPPGVEVVRGLPHPPEILVLVMTTNIEGNTSIQFNMTPEQAVLILRDVANNVIADYDIIDGPDLVPPLRPAPTRGSS